MVVSVVVVLVKLRVLVRVRVVTLSEVGLIEVLVVTDDELDVHVQVEEWVSVGLELLEQPELVTVLVLLVEEVS